MIPMRIAPFVACLVLLSVSPAMADSFVENFDSGTLDPQLVPHADPGYAQMIAGGKLDVTKADGTGAGSVFVFASFAVAQDFTVSVVANRTDLSGGAQLGLSLLFLGGSTAAISLDGSGSITGIIKGQSATQTVTNATATLQVRRTGMDVFCEYDTGGGFQIVQSLLGDKQLGKVNARPEMILVQVGSSTAAESGNFDDFMVNAGRILGGGGGATPTATVVGPTPTPRPSPGALDHFLSYVVKPTKNTPTFVPLGPVTLTDLTGTADYNVAGPPALALPADKNGGGRHDQNTHLLEYKIKRSKGAPKFTAGAPVRVLNQCSDIFLALKKPVSLLVPTAKDLASPVAAPIETNHQLDHFVCYKAKPQTVGTVLGKVPKGTQVDVVDQFQTRRYDLKSITKFCAPAAKSGSPLFLKGDAKGTPATIAPASIRHADSFLVCYKATPAKSEIPQLGCGPLDPKSKGTKISPAPAKHTPKTGIFVNNQLGPLRLDSVKELELCVPSVLPQA